MSKTNLAVTVIVILIIAGGLFYLERGETSLEVKNDTPTEEPADATSTTDEADNTSTSTEATSTDDQMQDSETNQGDGGVSVIGTSAGGYDITAHTFGDGDTQLLFVGGIHGGYSPNTSLLADRMIEWFNTQGESVIPNSVSVTVIPTLNQDGLVETVGTPQADFTTADIPSRSQRVAGRFNANGVDLNRNFACNWQTEAQWQDQSVDAGSSAFSEPEARALRDYVQQTDPDAAVIFYSAAGGVYSASCNGSASKASQDLMNTYAQASGYPAEGLFAAYEITGDAADWMAKNGVPAASVLLSDHTNTEWDKNKAGIEAVLQSYAE